MMNILEEAIIYATIMHQGRVRKFKGIPFILHPLEVAQILSTMTDDQEVITAGILHDIVEDTAYTIEDLAAMGFGNQVLDAIRLMTHTDGVSYMDYVAKIKTNPIARAVKLADLAHNSDLSRLDVIDDDAIARVEKYAAALRFLKE